MSERIRVICADCGLSGTIKRSAMEHGKTCPKCNGSFIPAKIKAFTHIKKMGCIASSMFGKLAGTPKHSAMEQGETFPECNGQLDAIDEPETEDSEIKAFILAGTIARIVSAIIAGSWLIVGADAIIIMLNANGLADSSLWFGIVISSSAILIGCGLYAAGLYAKQFSILFTRLLRAVEKESK